MIEWIQSTFLIERLYGITFYCLAVYIGFNSIKKNNVNIGLWLTLALLVILSFFYIPGKDADLVRIREMTAHWSEFTFEWAMVNKVFTSTVPVAYFMYFVVAKIGVPGLLPAISAFIFYANVFHIIKTLHDDRKCNNKVLATNFLLFMAVGAFVEVISGIRCFMALSIVARFAYDEYRNKQVFLLYLPFYIIASLTHPLALALSIFWIVFSTFRSIKLSRTKFLISILSFIALAIAGTVLGWSYIYNMLTKTEKYIDNNFYAYLWEYVIGAFQLLAYAFFIIKTWKTKKTALYVFSVILMLVMAGFCFEYSIFHRLATALSIFMIPVIATTDYEQYGIATRHIQWFAIIVLLLACARGNLCGFKFFVLS